MLSWAYNWLGSIQDTRIKNLKLFQLLVVDFQTLFFLIALWEDVLVVRYLEHAWCQLLQIILSFVQSGSGIQCVLSEYGKLDFYRIGCPPLNKLWNKHLDIGTLTNVFLNEELKPKLKPNFWVIPILWFIHLLSLVESNISLVSSLVPISVLVNNFLTPISLLILIDKLLVTIFIFYISNSAIPIFKNPKSSNTFLNAQIMFST